MSKKKYLDMLSGVFFFLLGAVYFGAAAKLPEPLTTARLIELWTPALANALEVSFVSIDYPNDVDEKTVADIAKEKYGNPDWKRK